MLTISGFSKKYPGNDHPVLSVPYLQTGTGIYQVKGENGSGKTSLIKSIAGLIPYTGNIAVNGIDLRSNRMAYTKQVNYAEAEPQYPPFLTGKELIDFYKSTKGGAFPDELTTSLGVDRFIQHRTAVYSSGMMKKLSLVLAFTGAPALILLDEPLIALDADAVTILQNAVISYHRKGVSFIITSHQPLHETIQFNGSFVISNQTLAAE